MRELEKIGVIPIDTAVLYNLFGTYQSPKDKVRRLEQSGFLVRLKNGLFIVSPDISKQAISVELIANHLYGPSYVSYERALYFHRLIPERVYTLKSATAKRKKNYSTPVGNFEYITVPAEYYPIGLQTIVVQSGYAYIIASPEKAICDLILSTSGLRFQSRKAIRAYLINDLRIDLDYITTWNTEIIESCAHCGYKKRELQLLLSLIKDEYTV